MSDKRSSFLSFVDCQDLKGVRGELDITSAKKKADEVAKAKKAEQQAEETAKAARRKQRAGVAETCNHRILPSKPGAKAGEDEAMSW